MKYKSKNKRVFPVSNIFGISIFFMSFLTPSFSSNKRIEVDLTSQTLYAIENNSTYLSTKISTGMAGHSTPTGKFNIFAKAKKNKSTLYPRRSNGRHGGASMPYTLRVTHDGVAIHQGELPKRNGKVYPASHGCIRVPYGTAKKLFDWTSISTPIEIYGNAKFNDHFNKKRVEYEKLSSNSDFDEKTVETVGSYYEEYSHFGESYDEADNSYDF